MVEETDMEELRELRQPKSRWQLRLSTIVWLLTMFTVLAAWYADHSKLQNKLDAMNPGPNIMKLASVGLSTEVKVYALANASPGFVKGELQKLFPKHRFAANMRTNTVIASADTKFLRQIESTIKRLDKIDSGLIDKNTTELK